MAQLASMHETKTRVKQDLTSSIWFTWCYWHCYS